MVHNHPDRPIDIGAFVVIVVGRRHHDSGAVQRGKVVGWGGLVWQSGSKVRALVTRHIESDQKR